MSLLYPTGSSLYPKKVCHSRFVPSSVIRHSPLLSATGDGNGLCYTMHPLVCAGSTFVRWGRSQCPSGATTIYSGQFVKKGPELNRQKN